MFNDDSHFSCTHKAKSYVIIDNYIMQKGKKEGSSLNVEAKEKKCNVSLVLYKCEV